MPPGAVVLPVAEAEALFAIETLPNLLALLPASRTRQLPHIAVRSVLLNAVSSAARGHGELAAVRGVFSAQQTR